MSYVEPHMKKSMEEMKLTQLNFRPLEMFYLKREGTGTLRTLIIFTKEGIVLTGDVMLGLNPSGGIVSQLGYGSDWFSSNLSEDYLCQKFLPKVWVSELAKKHMEYMLREDTDLDVEQRVSIEDAIRHQVYDSSYEFGQWWDNTFSDGPEDIGYGYDPSDAGWLCAIQQRFRESYLQLPK